MRQNELLARRFSRRILYTVEQRRARTAKSESVVSAASSTFWLHLIETLLEIPILYVLAAAISSEDRPAMTSNSHLATLAMFHKHLNQSQLSLLQLLRLGGSKCYAMRHLSQFARIGSSRLSHIGN